MDPAFALEIGRLAIFTVLMAAAPLLMCSLAVGLVIAVFQAATQVHEMTLVFVPKIAAVGTTLLLGAPWLIGKLAAFARQILENLPNVAG